jgi:hypothetical protein
MNKALTVLGSIGAVLSLGVGSVFAQTPTVYPVPAAANQLLVNVMASIQDAIYAVVAAIMPYAIPLMLFFLVLGVGIGLFNRFRH